MGTAIGKNRVPLLLKLKMCIEVPGGKATLAKHSPLGAPDKSLDIGTIQNRISWKIDQANETKTNKRRETVSELKARFNRCATDLSLRTCYLEGNVVPQFIK